MYDFSDFIISENAELLLAVLNNIAVIGDFTKYPSKSLKDFIYECNKGKDIFFLPDEAQVIEKLSTV